MQARPSNEAVKAFWSSQAVRHGRDVAATMPDRILKELEIRALLQHLPDSGRVLDVGCGNGYSDMRLADARDLDIVGVDYSQEMVRVARDAAVVTPPGRGRVRFEVGEVGALQFANDEFDAVVTDRCLINLTSLDDQRAALREIARVVKPGGRYLMCEDTQEGLARLNELRTRVGLYEITTRWHNLYLSEAGLAPTWESLFDLDTVDNFSSLYYLASRIFNARLAEIAGNEPSYDHPINQIAAELPSVGDYGPLKLFIFKKPHAA